MKLTANPASARFPKSITVEYTLDTVAIIYFDQQIAWMTTKQLPIRIVQQITAVAENFNLFYLNIPTHEG